MASERTTFRVQVDSPRSRASDWEGYCNETDGALPKTIASAGDADDSSETWIVTARTPREALARAERTARRLRVRVISSLTECVRG